MQCSKPEDVRTDWVFGYGSLIWNPEFEFDRADLARAHGYHRAFCIRSTRYRGTPEQPGLVLGLDRGGSCVGVAYRLPPASRKQAIELLFEREIPDPAARVYLPKIIEIRLRDASRVQALTFLADRSQPSYQRLDEAQIVQRLTGCHGQRGANRDYALSTWKALQAHGVHDVSLTRLAALLDPVRLEPECASASALEHPP
jgi:cation transport protein ChaC